MKNALLIGAGLLAAYVLLKGSGGQISSILGGGGGGGADDSGGTSPADIAIGYAGTDTPNTPDTGQGAIGRYSGGAAGYNVAVQQAYNIENAFDLLTPQAKAGITGGYLAASTVSSIAGYQGVRAGVVSAYDYGGGAAAFPAASRAGIEYSQAAFNYSKFASSYAAEHGGSYTGAKAAWNSQAVGINTLVH